MVDAFLLLKRALVVKQIRLYKYFIISENYFCKFAIVFNYRMAKA